MRDLGVYHLTQANVQFDEASKLNCGVITISKKSEAMGAWGKAALLPFVPFSTNDTNGLYVPR